MKKIAIENCTICGNKSVRSENYNVSGVYPLYHCNICGLSLLDLSSEKQESAGFDDYWNNINIKIYSQDRVINELKNKYLKYFKKIKDTPSNKFLDVGSGSGICVDTANKYGFNAMGVEPSESGVKLSRQKYGISVENKLLTKDDDLPRDFSVLTLWDVIEHVIDPEEIVQDCASHITSGGYFILETPDEGAFIRKAIRLADKMFPFLNLREYLYYRAHRYYFTTKAMKKLLERCGFEDIHFYKEHSMYQKGLLKNKLYSGRGNLKDTLYRATLLILSKMPFLANKMVVVAKKK